MRTFPILATLVFASAVYAADACKPAALEGPYGFQLSGTTKITADAKPVASVGRIVFDSGNLSGISSVNFAGFFLGNPVTGTYEVREDCTLTWSLQDDSGAFQHFAGKLTPDLMRGEFHQTDPGGANNGMLVKLPASCSAVDLQHTYHFTVSGDHIPMNPGESAGHTSATGDIQIDQSGNVTMVTGDGSSTTAGSAQVDEDCMVEMNLSLSRPIKLRGVLASGGREILAMQTDPGAAVIARFMQH